MSWRSKTSTDQRDSQEKDETSNRRRQHWRGTRERRFRFRRRDSDRGKNESVSRCRVDSPLSKRSVVSTRHGKSVVRNEGRRGGSVVGRWKRLATRIKAAVRGDTSMPSGEVSGALDFLNTLSFPRGDLDSRDCEAMIVCLCALVPHDSEMLTSKFCAFVNAVSVKVHLTFTHNGLATVLKYFIQLIDMRLRSVFATDALKTLGSILIENGERCSLHADDIVRCLRGFVDTASVHLEAKHAAILALANLCAKAGKSLREEGRAKQMLDIFMQNFYVHSAQLKTEAGDPSGVVLAQLLASTLYGLEMSLAANESLHDHLSRPDEMLSSLHRLLGYNILPHAIDEGGEEDADATSQAARVRVHSVSLLSRLIRRRTSPIRSHLLQRLDLFLPSNEHDALASKPSRTTLATLILYDSQPSVRSGSMNLASAIVQVVPSRLLQTSTTTASSGRSSSQSTAMSLSERTRNSTMTLVFVLIEALRKERVNTSIGALLASVDVVVQALPWDSEDSTRALVHLIRALRVHAAPNGKHRARALRALATCFGASRSIHICTLALKKNEAGTCLVEEIVHDTCDHASIVSGRFAVLSAFARSFPDATCDMWTQWIVLLRRSFSSMQEKTRAGALRVAGSLFRVVSTDECDRTLKALNGWLEFVTHGVGRAIQDPSAAVRAAAMSCLMCVVGSSSWDALPRRFTGELLTRLARAATSDSSDSGRASACRLLGAILCRKVSSTCPRSEVLFETAQVMTSAMNDSNLTVRAAACGSLADVCASLQTHASSYFASNDRTESIVVWGRALLRACADHDRVAASAVRGIGSVACVSMISLSSRDEDDGTTHQLLSDCLSQLRLRLVTSRESGAGAHKTAWNSCAALEKVADTWRSTKNVSDDFVASMRASIVALGDALRGTTNLKVMTRASDAIGTILRVGGRSVLSPNVRVSSELWCLLLDTYALASAPRSNDRAIERKYRANLKKSLSHSLHVLARCARDDDTSAFLRRITEKDTSPGFCTVRELYDSRGVVCPAEAPGPAEKGISPPEKVASDRDDGNEEDEDEEL